MQPLPKAGGQWNVYEITADVQDSKHASGPIALQYAPGVVKDAGIVKFRKLQIRAL